MREIKFRAWDIHSTEMQCVHNIYVDAEHKISAVEIFNHSVGNYEKLERPNFNIMQYTGLKDKNGKEIYEGDIVKIKTIDEKTSDKSELYLIVEFSAGKYWVLDKLKNEHAWELIEVKQVMEVVGNIHENPELVK